MLGLFKSLVFGPLIATAGCQGGLACGRSSAAVGQATTRAVVTAIVYLVVADAVFNILCQELQSEPVPATTTSRTEVRGLTMQYGRG